MRVCVCCPYPASYSETFIKAHIDLLPNAFSIEGDWPMWAHEGKSIISPALRAAMRFGDRVHSQVPAKAEARSRSALARFFQKQKVTAVLAEYGTTAAGLTPICEEAGIPLIAHFHGSDAYHHDLLSEYGKRYQHLFHQASAIVGVSGHMVSQLVSLGAPKEKVHYNSCGVDIEKFTPTNPASAPPHFVSVGRFVDKKAPHLTVLAFSNMLQECPSAHLHMVGDGPLQDATIQLVRALRITDNVTFHGRRNPSEVRHILNHARAFVQHSLTATHGDCEGTPVGVLEASATALPVISTRHTGICEAVVDGTTGLLCDENDVQQMTANMAAVALNPELAAQLGAAGRAHISARYSMSGSIANLTKIIAATQP